MKTKLNQWWTSNKLDLYDYFFLLQVAFASLLIISIVRHYA